MAQITAPALRIEQDGRNVFLTRFTVADFMSPGFYRVEKLVARTPTEKKEAGYQRELQGKRASAFANYIREQDAILPTSVLLATEKKLAFNAAEGTITVKTSGTKTRPFFYIVDGQHRIAGLEKAVEKAARRADAEYLRAFPVATVIVSGLDETAQMVQFLIVNTTQKKVPAAVGQEILAQFAKMHEVEKTRGMPKSVRDVIEVGLEHKALDLVKHLNRSPGSPWRGKIEMANIAAESPGVTIKADAFVNSLKAHVLVGEHPLALQPDEGKRCRMLENYWRAIVARCVDDTQADLEKMDIPLFKTAGVEIFHRASLAIFGHLAKEREYFVGSFGDCLDAADALIEEGPYAGMLSPDWWKKGGEGASHLIPSARVKAASALGDAVGRIYEGEDKDIQC